MKRRQPETLLSKSLTVVVELVLRLSRCLEAIEDIQSIVGAIPFTLVNEFTSMVIPSLEHPSVELLQSCVHPALRSLDMSRILPGFLKVNSGVMTNFLKRCQNMSRLQAASFNNPCHNLISNELLDIFYVIAEWLTLLHAANNWRAEIQEQMCAVLPRLQLGQLSLSRKVTSLSFSSKLVSFSYPAYCSDSIIEELAMTCKSLQVLDVSRANRVTDECIPSLLQLQELQELNVTCVELTEEACARLMFGLCKLRKWHGGYVLLNVYEGCSESMKDYTTVIVDTTHCLADYFPNLTHLSVTDLCIPDALESFGTLEHLIHFNVGFPFEYDLGMREFINIHGENLLTFSVHEVLEMDFLHLVTMCPKLKTLQLEDCFISITSMEAKRSLPHFQSVEKLEVIVSREEWLLGGFGFPFFDYSNLRHLVAINVRQIDDTSLCQAIMERGWLRELRTLELRGNLGHLCIRAFMQLLKHCPHLESVSDLAAWPGVPQVVLNSIRNISKRENLDIKILAYPDPIV